MVPSTNGLSSQVPGSWPGEASGAASFPGVVINCDGACGPGLLGLEPLIAGAGLPKGPGWLSQIWQSVQLLWGCWFSIAVKQLHSFLWGWAWPLLALVSWPRKLMGSVVLSWLQWLALPLVWSLQGGPSQTLGPGHGSGSGFLVQISCQGQLGYSSLPQGECPLSSVYLTWTPILVRGPSYGELQPGPG